MGNATHKWKPIPPAEQPVTSMTWGEDGMVIQEAKGLHVVLFMQNKRARRVETPLLMKGHALSGLMRMLRETIRDAGGRDDPFVWLVAIHMKVLMKVRNNSLTSQIARVYRNILLTNTTQPVYLSCSTQ